METQQDCQARPARATSALIAWLSVCMLAAAWGARMGPEWVTAWRDWGAFGLTAAVGLNVADRLRLARRKRREEADAQQLLERRISTVIEEESAEEYARREPANKRDHQLVM
ncbi:MAG TPA: hypothetical protein VHD36_03965 [Pirellulales bacterium]|nr:hypothetical protein [Pirellulales bacterium]